MAVLIGFLPWIFFWFLVGANEFQAAAVGGLVFSAIWLAWSQLEGRSLKWLDVGGLVFFAVMTVVAFTADDAWVARWSYVISSAALGVVMLASIAMGQPFVRQYAKENTPPEAWETSGFKETTLTLTWMWLVIVALNVLFAWLAIEFPGEALILGLAVPFGLVVVGLRANHWYPEHVQRRATTAR